MTPAIRALETAGIDHRVLRYARASTRQDYGAEAVEALGLDAATVFKTLLVVADGDLAVAVLPVERMLSMKAVASALGAKRASMCAPAEAERATGYVVGGISPIGQRRSLPTLIDESAQVLDEIHVSAGRRGLEIALAPEDLRATTRGAYAPLTS